MMIVGIILSSHALNLMDESILNISADLRQVALVIILTRAGLSLDVSDLKKVGRPAVLMCFVPACIEMVGTVLLAPILLEISRLEVAVMRNVIAAVSQAVVVPRMIWLIEEGYGKKNGIPQLILVGASVDDVFTTFISLASAGKISAVSFLQISVSILFGIAVGVVIDMILVKILKKIHMRDSVKLLILLSVSLLLLELKSCLEDTVLVSDLLAIMSVGIVIKQKYEVLAVRLSDKYNKLWVEEEIFLFVLEGQTLILNTQFPQESLQFR